MKKAEDNRKMAARQVAPLKALVNTVPNAKSGIAGNTNRRPESPARPKDPQPAEEDRKLPAVPNTAVAQRGHQLTSTLEVVTELVCLSLVINRLAYLEVVKELVFPSLVII